MPLPKLNIEGLKVSYLTPSLGPGRRICAVVVRARGALFAPRLSCALHAPLRSRRGAWFGLMELRYNDYDLGLEGARRMVRGPTAVEEGAMPQTPLSALSPKSAALCPTTKSPTTLGAAAGRGLRGGRRTRPTPRAPSSAPSWRLAPGRPGSCNTCRACSRRGARQARG